MHHLRHLPIIPAIGVFHRCQARLASIVRCRLFLLDFVLHDGKEKRFVLDAIWLDADAAVILAIRESIRNFWRLLLVELLVDMTCLSDLVHADVLVEACQLLLVLRQ